MNVDSLSLYDVTAGVPVVYTDDPGLSEVTASVPVVDSGPHLVTLVTFQNLFRQLLHIFQTYFKLKSPARKKENIHLHKTFL